VRLFFAVELPPRVQQALAGLRPAAEDDARGDYRWSDPALLHVTLAFLGERPDAELPSLESIGRAAAEQSSTGRLRIGHAGQFGARRAPRVLFVSLDGDLDALLHLQANLERDLRAAGYPLEDRAFKPHVTLARRRQTARGGAPPGWPPADVPRSAFELHELTLFQSRLSPRGPSYIPLARFALAARADP
jgi:RNA 2',3'-cyclic 3'-phosphodiesterase